MRDRSGDHFADTRGGAASSSGNAVGRSPNLMLDNRPPAGFADFEPPIVPRAIAGARLLSVGEGDVAVAISGRGGTRANLTGSVTERSNSKLAGKLWIKKFAMSPMKALVSGP